MSQDILKKIIHNPEIEMPLSAHYLDKLNFYEKEQGKWYLQSFDSEGKEKLVYNEHTGKSAPEEVVRQLFLYELINKYGYPKDRIKIEQSVTFGRDEKKRADVIVYQNDNSTPWIVAEIKAPNQKNNIQQLRSYLNAEGSPIGVGFNGKNISRFIRPYPKEFETLTDLPYEHEYQTAIGADNLIQKIKELISNRTWTLLELNKLNAEKQFDLRAIIEELEELVLANSGVESFNEIFKLIYAKLYDEFEAVNRDNETLFFRDYGNAQITYKKISELFKEAKTEWKNVFDENETIKLTPEHLEICIGKLTEVKLYGANLRIIDEAFEYLVSEVSKGKKGQYFTPRVVIDACVQILNPKRREYVLDPACGSAGFLVHTMQYVWDKYQMKDYRTQSGYAFKYLWGIDFDERAAKISRAVMLIGGDGRTHIYKQNALEYDKWDKTLQGDLKEEGMLKTDNPKNLEFDIIMSNPPFAGEIKEKAIINLYHDLLGLRYTFNMEASNIKAILKSLTSEFNVEFEDDSETQIKDKVKEINKNGDINLENEEDVTNALNEICDLLIDLVVSGNLRKNLLFPRLREMVKYKKTQTKWEKVDRHILFIQRILDMLKEGGRCVIVLPQGIFNNSSEKYLRRFLFDKARILGVIGLHTNSFKPHTGTKTSLLFLHKYTQAELTQQKNKSDYPIFFATSKLSFKDNSGRYVFATDQDGNAILDKYKNQMYFTDLFSVVEAFKEFGLEELKNGDKSFEFLADLQKNGN